ncbi:desiccation-related protein PCC13-62-like [Malania oleifera]|uniref:desiccation-related protein PCC13-62-like n=1 Tax=Malania oleifera TaxID=397392 RepID=UPI0025AE781C|nr:desiccation-related protein PCC13-62-like [Malania oleifera]
MASGGVVMICLLFSFLLVGGVLSSGKTAYDEELQGKKGGGGGGGGGDGSGHGQYEHEDDDEDVPAEDVDLLEFPLNLEFLEAEFFSWGALGRGLDDLAPDATMGGPSPLGPRIANLDPFTRDIITQFAYQEVGHLKAIQSIVKGFPRPLLDLSIKSFATVINSAFGRSVEPPFNPYANTLSYLIASYAIPYVGLTGYVGASPKLQGATSKRLVAGLLGVESGQDAVIRALLYQHALQRVYPYGITVAEFTNRISKLRDHLGDDGVKDEGLIVPEEEGAKGKITGNVLAGNDYSISYARTP